MVPELAAQVAQGRVAQLVEQQTLNLLAESSSLSSLTMANDPGSSNGRMAVFDTAHGGSNPSPGTDFWKRFEGIELPTGMLVGKNPWKRSKRRRPKKYRKR